MRTNQGKPLRLGGLTGDLDFRFYADVLWRKRRVVVACLLTALALALGHAFLSVPIYEATTTLEIERQGPEVLTFKDVVSVDPSGYRAFYQSQYRNLESRAVIGLAIERIDLRNNTEWASRRDSPIKRLRGAVKRLFGAPTPVDVEQRMIEFVERGLVITPVRYSQHVEIAFRDRSPELARDVANAMAIAFQHFNSQTRYATSEQATEFLAKDVALQQARIADLEEQLQRMSSKRGLLALSDSAQDISEQALADLNERLSVARAELARAEARHRTLTDSPADALPEVLQSALIRSLKEQCAALERRRNQLAEKFKPGWPEYVEVEVELSTARERLELEVAAIASQVRAAAEAGYQQASAEVRNLDRLVESQKTEVKRVNLDAIAYSALKEEIETERQVLNDKIKRRSETETSTRLQSTETSNIRIVDPAALPTEAISPNKISDLLLGLLFGAGLGVGAALLLHYVDNSIKTERDVEVYAQGLAILGHIPNLRTTRAPLRGGEERRRGPRVVISLGGGAAAGPRRDIEPSAVSERDTDRACHLEPKSVFAEAFRNVRTSLLLSSPDHPPRSISVTSSNLGDGKSTVCQGLAIVLAQQDKRVLLVDADLRRPRIHRSFGIPNEVGLSSFLTGNAERESLIQATDVPGLSVVTSGPTPPNPAELIDSPKIGKFVDFVTQNLGYDHVLFDSPPALQVADAIILATRVDGVVLVISVGETSRDALQMATGRLGQSRGNVFGCVMNRVREDVGYFNDYAYHYAYDSRSRATPSRRASLAARRQRPSA